MPDKVEEAGLKKIVLGTLWIDRDGACIPIEIRVVPDIIHAVPDVIHAVRDVIHVASNVIHVFLDNLRVALALGVWLQSLSMISPDYVDEI